MYQKYGEERTERYVAGNMGADKRVEKQDLPEHKFNKYQNEYIIQNNREKKTKKNMHKPDIINTRGRKTIKEITREEYNNTIIKRKI